MNILIIHAHPEPKSFNAAMTATAVDWFTANGDAVTVSDLYAMNFDPVSDRRNFLTAKDPSYYKQQIEEIHASQIDGFSSDIKNEIEKLEACDGLILQFPLWWFGMPAILKGWADRVLVMGRVYGGGKFYDNGAFKGRRAMVSVSTGGPETMYRSDGLNGDIHQILFPINHGILRFTGFDVLPPFIAYAPAHVNDEDRRSYLDMYRKRLAGFQTDTPIRYPSLNDYDPNTFQRQSKEE
ncbi:MAG: NAD(P)H-dependent oxidoreductase [Desulfosarcina sp.]|jgi:NAD(P)H dehydrogenase (quinone)